MLERRVTFLVRDRSDVELSCDRRVRIDRSGDGSAGRSAALLESGSHRLSLPRGVYSLRARHGGEVRVVHGGCGALPGEPGVDPWPERAAAPVGRDGEPTLPRARRAAAPEEERP